MDLDPLSVRRAAVPELRDNVRMHVTGFIADIRGCKGRLLAGDLIFRILSSNLLNIICSKLLASDREPWESWRLLMPLLLSSAAYISMHQKLCSRSNIDGLMLPPEETTARSSALIKPT